MVISLYHTNWAARIAGIALLIVAAMLFSPPAALRAQTTTYTGLDIVFLVDQSGSMGGSAFGSATSATNDPLGLRFEAAQYALRTLNEYRLVVPPDTTFRLAVVSFGDTGELTLPWTEIGGADWDAQEATLLAQLSSDAFGNRNLGNTNFLGAYEAAQQLFAELPPDEPHLHVLVILTDGAPCAPALFADPNCTDPDDQYQHMNEVVALTTTAFPPPDYRLYVIAIDNADTYWPRFSVNWQQVVSGRGSANRIADSTGIGQNFLAILVELMQALRGNTTADATIGAPVAMVNQTATVAVPPYHQSMRITVFKSAPDAGLTITGPDGLAITPATPGVSVSGVNDSIETWTITDPQPGSWQLTTPLDASLVDVYLDLIQVDWAVEVAPSAVRYVPLPVTLRIFDSDGSLLPDYSDPRYRLVVQVTQHTPAGMSAQVALTSTGFGEYTGEIIPDQVGLYTLDLLATTQNVDGSPMTVANQTAVASFMIDPLTLQATSQPEGDLLTSESVAISTWLADAGGTPILPDGVVFDVICRGQSTETSYRLVTAQNNVFTQDIVMEERGQFQFIARASLEQADGSLQLIDEIYLPAFRVEPANYVLLALLAPENDSQQYTTGGFPPIQTTDLVIEVETTGSDGANLDLTALANGALPLLLTVVDADGNDVTGGALLAAADTIGLYRAAVSGLGQGDFTVTVTADESARLDNSTLFDARTRTQTAVIQRKLNPGFIATLVVAGVGGLALIGAVGFTGWRTYRRRQHVAAGQLVIYTDEVGLSALDDARSVLWRISLDGFRSNRIVMKRLPLGLTRLLVECSSLGMAQRRQVTVTLWHKQRKIVDRALMGRGSMRALPDLGGGGESTYYLAKDPSEDL